MAQFFKAFTNILDLPLAVTIHALLVGLCPGIFLDYLYSSPPTNMDALHTRVARYISIEEKTRMSKNWQKLPPQPLLPITFKKRNVSKYENCIPLNASQNVIIQEAFNLELVGCLNLHPLFHSMIQPRDVSIIKIKVTSHKNVIKFMILLKRSFEQGP